MDWIQTIFLILTMGGINIALFSLFKSEIQSIRSDMKADMIAIRSDTKSEIISIRDLIATIHEETHAESKDFHGRLCTIEERYRNKE